MSHTAGRTSLVRRATIAAAAAVVLLSACGGDDPGTESAATDGGAGTGEAEPTAPSGASEFCAQAAEIEERVDSALSDAPGDDPSVPDAFSQIAEEFRAIEAPESISADWAAMAGGLDLMADAFADFDITDSESLAALESAEQELSTASANVETYLRDECGIEP